MKTLLRSKLVLGTACFALLGAITYACKNFLDTPSQGTIQQETLLSKAGVEAALIAAYRMLDCTNSVGAWGCAASNWPFGDITSDDAYKGSEASDQPGATQIELYNWTTGQAPDYLDQKWSTVYEGVVRANSTLRLLERVQTVKPTEIPAGDAKGIRGEALFLRAHYHFVGALATFDTITTSGPYALETSFDHVWTGFQGLKNGKETIFAYEASSNDGEPNGQNANWGETLNFPHSGSPFGCCGFHQPSQNLANFYAVDGATGLPLAVVSPATWNTRNAKWIASAADTVDPRLDWTIGRDSVPYKDWGLMTPEWIRAPGYGGPYSPKKNVAERASGSASQVGWNAPQLNSVHIHLFRYADLLLMKAEAETEVGSLANATTLVNLIRTRAGVTAQGCGGAVKATPVSKADTIFLAKYPKCAGDTRMVVPLNDSTIKWATYKVLPYPATFADKATARIAIRAERRLELGMEGQRFFDLRRYGEPYATQIMKDYLDLEKTRRTYKQAQSYFTTRNMFFPIPQIEIDLSKVGTASQLTQNTGW